VVESCGEIVAVVVAVVVGLQAGGKRGRDGGLFVVVGVVGVVQSMGDGVG
jgi:hypothetical protein